jgi:hypothetical protein
MTKHDRHDIVNRRWLVQKRGAGLDSTDYRHFTKPRFLHCNAMNCI